MPSFDLKRYQTQALQARDEFLQAAALLGPRAAFEQRTGYGYNDRPFGDVPCVCLRIPTGGGKTLLGAHAPAPRSSSTRRTTPRPSAASRR